MDEDSSSNEMTDELIGKLENEIASLFGVQDQFDATIDDYEERIKNHEHNEELLTSEDALQMKQKLEEWSIEMRMVAVRAVKIVMTLNEHGVFDQGMDELAEGLCSQYKIDRSQDLG